MWSEPAPAGPEPPQLPAGGSWEVASVPLHTLYSFSMWGFPELLSPPRPQSSRSLDCGDRALKGTTVKCNHKARALSCWVSALERPERSLPPPLLGGHSEKVATTPHPKRALPNSQSCQPLPTSCHHGGSPRKSMLCKTLVYDLAVSPSLVCLVYQPLGNLLQTQCVCPSYR